MPHSSNDQDPKDYAAGKVHEIAPGQTGGIHDHVVIGRRYRHSHAGWDTGHTHPRDDHDYEPGDSASPMTTDPSCRICGEGKRSHR